MLKLAVIGKDVSKSQSPQMHAFIAEHTGEQISYDKVSIPEIGFENTAPSLFEKYDGFNVTIPYKLSIIPHLNKVCGDALTFGAVNTVRTNDRSGHNTDGWGFYLMLKSNGVQVEGKRVLLLGAGGAGRSVAAKLKQHGAQVFVYDTRTDSAKALAVELGVTAITSLTPQNYYLIINATGVGMHNTEGISPVDDSILALCEVAVDLIYVPAKSQFLLLAERLGKQTINGAAMLFYQAYCAQCIFFERQPSEQTAISLFARYSEANK